MHDNSNTEYIKDDLLPKDRRIHEGLYSVGTLIPFASIKIYFERIAGIKKNYRDHGTYKKVVM